MGVRRYFSLKNRMLIYNLFTNLIGVWIVVLLSFRSISPPFYEIAEFAHRVNLACIPTSFILSGLVQLAYEWPIRGYLNLERLGAPIANVHERLVHQRLLNAPFFIMGLDLIVWVCGAFIYAILYLHFGAGALAAYQVLFQNMLVGLITATAVFFVQEQVLRKSMVPHFFPQGNLARTPKTVRIRIRTRLAALLFGVNIIPIIAFLILALGTYESKLTASILLEHLQETIITYSLVAIALGICLTALVSHSLTRPIGKITSVLKRIRSGRLDGRVSVTTNDEIGYAGDVINEMTAGLRERERLRQSLELAREVQLNLLPAEDPAIAGLDIAGKSRYCDETGGDYYDYLDLPNETAPHVGVVIGDVSDHGIQSALLMTTARALLRQRATMPGSLAHIVTDVNRQLTLDSEKGGQFMTLFLLALDILNMRLRWVRAGHEPALIYDPISDLFEELKGPGAALGIDTSMQYEENSRRDLREGQIIVLSTDGIWEARNHRGESFGKERLLGLIRQQSNHSAKQIINTVFKAVKDFQQGYPPEDDITLVIIKINHSSRVNNRNDP